MTKILICDSDENPLKTGNNDNIKVNKVILNPPSTVGDLRRFLARTYGDEGFNTYSLRYYICLPTGDPRAEKVNSYFDTIPDNETPLANLVLEEKEKKKQERHKLMQHHKQHPLLPQYNQRHPQQYRKQQLLHLLALLHKQK